MRFGNEFLELFEENKLNSGYFLKIKRIKSFESLPVFFVTYLFHWNFIFLFGWTKKKKENNKDEIQNAYLYSFLIRAGDIHTYFDHIYLNVLSLFLCSYYINAQLYIHLRLNSNIKISSENKQSPVKFSHFRFSQFLVIYNVWLFYSLDLHLSFLWNERKIAKRMTEKEKRNTKKYFPVNVKKLCDKLSSQVGR